MIRLQNFGYGAQLTLFAVALFSFPLFAHAQSVFHVRAGATGDNNGADWNNAFTTLPATLQRGATYYLADGSYDEYTFNDAESGSALITIKKATALSHGTETGWLSAYGDGQATFSGQIRFTTGYWIFDGQTGGGPGSWTSGFGFKINVTGQTSGTGILIQGDSDFIRVEHFEIEGNGGDGAAFPWNDGVGTNWDGANDLTVRYAYIHDMGRTAFFLHADNIHLEFIYTGKFESTPSQHAEIAVINMASDPAYAGVSNVTIANSLFTHFEGTGGLMLQGDDFEIYGNVFYQDDTAVYHQAPNGVVGTWTGFKVTNCRVYNNTFGNIGPNGTALGLFFGSESLGNQVYNNIFYKTKVDTGNTTHNYNHMADLLSSTPSEPNGTTSTVDPFVDSANGNFSLKSPTASAMNLGSPYNMDMYGTNRDADGIWQMGAIEPELEVSPPSSPTELRVD